MFEHRRQPLLPRKAFFLRILRHGGIGLGVISGSLFLGILGYRGFEGLSWVDATVNAAMILGGMGPVNQLNTTAGKLFASFYALFSGIVFLVVVALLLAPIFHRFFHRFHLEWDSESSADDRSGQS